jgi:hypothetical protein
MIAGEVVLIHVHEGTIISSWSFTDENVQADFEHEHRSTDEGLRYLPDGTFDDPGSDTWIVVEAAMVEYVDGERPTPVTSVEVTPRCDICDQPEDHTPGFIENNWNGETGNHISCEVE